MKSKDSLPFPFIVGVGRSGTTLLRLMLDSHSQLSIPAETGFVAGLLGDKNKNLSAQELFQYITTHPCWSDLALSKKEFFDKLLLLESYNLTEGIKCFYILYAQKHNKVRFGDKTPGYCLHIDEIQNLFPEARFIHIIRDGRDVALSVRPLWFSPSKDIKTIATDWSNRIQKTRELSKHCNYYIEIKYETLITDPKNEIAKILKFIDLPFEEQVLDYYKHAHERLTEVQNRYNDDGSLLISKNDRLYNHRNTSQPPLVENLSRWKKEMTENEIREFEAVAHETLKELGYEINFPIK
jgi:hypothetical protein